MLERGFDVPSVEHVILARPLRKSFSSHVQMVGRGARPSPGKEFCVIQDHSNNWLRFLDDWNHLCYNGIQSLDSGIDKKSRKEPARKEKEAAKCPKCSHYWPAKSDICSHCGFVRQSRNKVTSKPGQLIELGNTLKAETEYKRSFFHQLLTYQDSKPTYKQNWARVKYHEKFGEWPTFDESGRAPIKKEVGNWIRSRFIKYAKSVSR